MPMSARRGSRRRAGVRPERGKRAPSGGACAGAPGTLAAAIGASHRLRCSTSGSCGATHFARCARFVQTQRRKSEVRSALRAPTPRLRCSAPPKSPAVPRGPPPHATARRPATRAASPDAGPPPLAAQEAWVAFASKTGLLSTNTTTVSAKARAVRRGRALCAAEKRSGTGGARSAHRPSFSRRLSERSSRSERSEFRRASR